MCGVTGLFDSRGERPFDRALVSRMNDSQIHRGPDESGIFLEPGVALAHRRLSIIDLSSGQQPMASQDGQIVVSFNGEIYNYQDVRRQLQQYGYAFRTNSDTEVILYAWAEWGESCVNRFRGMFAFALFDRRTQSLFLARDRLGVKPMHYALLGDGQVVFGSELKSLLCHPGVSRTVDPQAVENFFAYGYVPDPQCIVSSVRKLPAGHTLVIRRGAAIPAPRCYWDVQFGSTLNQPEAELTAELIDRVREAVRIRLVSEVPLGAFLSGGVDSSAVVAIMAGLSADPVNTCSIGFDVEAYDETSYAAQVAERYNTNHRARTVSADDISLIDRLVFAYDEPFADSSALPTLQVCALARESVTVALSGDGGDELFAGYRRYRLHAAEERLRAGLPLAVRQPLFGLLGRIYPKLDWAPRYVRAKTTLQSLGMSTARAYFNSVCALRNDERDRLFSPGFKRDLQGYRAEQLLVDVMEKAPADDPLSQVQYADIKTWLPGDILTKVDRASMAVSLEAREPLLDHQLLEWAARLPPSMRLRQSQGKYILKRAFEPYLPHDLLYRPKMGFSVPVSNWFRGALRGFISNAIQDPTIADSGLFDMTVVNRMVADHLEGHSDHGRLLWQFLMFGLSIQRIKEQSVVAAA